MKNKDYHLNKVYCEITITATELSLQEITRDLGIEPHRSFEKGQLFKSDHSNSNIRRPHNLWAISSETEYTDLQDVQSHINYLNTLLKGKIEVLKRFKEDKRVDVTVWVWIETEDSGIGIDIMNDELSFLCGSINRIHISHISVDRIQN